MKISENATIAKGAVVLGDVELCEGANVWYNAVIRADVGPVKIGRNSNVQDCAVVHLDYGTKVEIGENVTIGHGAIIHGCTIKDNVVVGMGATILNNAIIEEDCIIGAGALVTQGKVIPRGSLVMGVPAKVIRELTPDEIKASTENALHYIELAKDIIK